MRQLRCWKTSLGTATSRSPARPAPPSKRPAREPPPRAEGAARGTSSSGNGKGGPDVARQFTLRTLGITVLLILASCADDSTGPAAGRLGRVAIVPRFESRAFALVDFNRVRLVLARLKST